MKERNNYTLMVNGFSVNATFTKASIETIWNPLLQRLRTIYEKKQKRVIVFLVAPPAVGKSTLAGFLEMLSLQDGKEEIQSIGLDGFHYPACYLQSNTIVKEGKEVCMNDVKGCPETFDIESIKKTIQSLQEEEVMWPIYDRNLHDVVFNQIGVTKNIVLIEGNWLLLKDTAWKSLKTLSDFTIKISAEEEMLKQRLINRKIRGGSTLEKAEAFYENSDQANIVRVLKNSQEADLHLYLCEDFDYKEAEENV